MVPKQIYDRNRSKLQSVNVNRTVVQLTGRDSGLNSWGFSCSYERECPIQPVVFQGEMASVTGQSFRCLLYKCYRNCFNMDRIFFSFTFDSWNSWFVWNIFKTMIFSTCQAFGPFSSLVYFASFYEQLEKASYYGKYWSVLISSALTPPSVRQVLLLNTVHCWTEWTHYLSISLNIVPSLVNHQSCGSSFCPHCDTATN